MRLYMLLSRIGQKKERLWPWFKAPVAGPPVRYDGWFWEPATGEWLPSEMAPMRIMYVTQLWPKPTQLPSREFSSSQPGWGYDFKTYEWVKTVIVGTPIDFVPPRTLPPYVTDEMMRAEISMVEEYRKHYEMLISMGLQPHEAKRCAEITGEYMIAIMKAKHPELTKRVWKGYSRELQAQSWMINQQLILGAVMVAMGAVIGITIGGILEKLSFPEVDVFTMKEPKGTYLLRYDHYLYGRMIGISPKGTPFYSACEDIGTSYIRHRRAPRGSRVDIIDFPGGFVEEGHRGAYFVKYTWRAWTLEYIGFLTSYGENFYALREGNYDHNASGKAPFMIEETEWCKGFHWYL